MLNCQNTGGNGWKLFLFGFGNHISSKIYWQLEIEPKIINFHLILHTNSYKYCGKWPVLVVLVQFKYNRCSISQYNGKIIEIPGIEQSKTRYRKSSHYLLSFIYDDFPKWLLKPYIKTLILKTLKHRYWKST